VSLDEKSLDRLQDALLSYPLNLRLEIERAIAEEVPTSRRPPASSTPCLRHERCRDRPHPGQDAREAHQDPKGFERRTGEALEAEQEPSGTPSRRTSSP
jgi:hypothetical protein